MELKQIVVGPLGTNCYMMMNPDTKKVILVDPGGSPEKISGKIHEMGGTLTAILLTHGHFDHILAVPELIRMYEDAKVYAYEDEEDLIINPSKNCSTMVGRSCMVEPHVYVKDGEKLTLEDIHFEVIASPGHTKGSCCYYLPEEKFLFSGDTIFAESVGRTDLPTGNMGQLVRSVRKLLEMLPDDTLVYPGHAHSTSIEHEKRYNPFA